MDKNMNTIMYKAHDPYIHLPYIYMDIHEHIHTVHEHAPYMFRYIYTYTYRQCCASEIIFSGSGSYLDLNFGSGSGFESGSSLFMKNTLEIQMI